MIKILYDKINHSNNNSTLWKPDNSSIYNKFTQNIDYIEPVIEEIVQVESIKVKPKKIQKKTLLKPLDIILKESNTFNDFKENIKEKLIHFISQKEFSKVFGITKSSEVMSGIVNNRWNKATALFISFLFGKSIEYNDTIVSYNKDTYKGIIVLTI
jgi:hypothetical protein|tara:strand:+ start:496 stop:963 length:468 start_codon:yes stop_codon:yes gene_type:complete